MVDRLDEKIGVATIEKAITIICTIFLSTLIFQTFFINGSVCALVLPSPELPTPARIGQPSCQMPSCPLGSRKQSQKTKSEDPVGPAILAVEWEYMWPSPPPVPQQDAAPLRLPDGAGSSGVHVAPPASVVEPFCPAAGGQKDIHHQRVFLPPSFSSFLAWFSSRTLYRC